MPPRSSSTTAPDANTPAAPRELSAVDLFAGAGGFSLGLRRAGFNVVLANEFSVDPEWTYRHNLVPDELTLEKLPPGATGYAIRGHRLRVREKILKLREEGANGYGGTMRGGDIGVALSDEWLSAWVERRGGREVDVLVAGPPCQGFSSAGKQDDSDVRNQLVFEAVRVINILKPKIVVIENVPGMLARRGTILRDVGSKLSEGSRGYFMAVELLHGHLMGVPQTRKRLALVGVRRDLMDASGHARLRESVFPVGCPVLGFGGSALGDGGTLTAHEVLGDLAAHPPVYDTTYAPQAYRDEAGESAFRVEMRTIRKAYLAGNTGGAPLIASCWNHEASVHNETVRARMRKLRQVADRDDVTRDQRCSSRWLRKHFINEHPDLDTKKAAQRVLLPTRWPGLTVTSLPDDIVHFEEDRIPTVREVARLQTFPDWFEFKGVRTTGFERRRAGVYVPQYTQVANAVPPRLAHAVAARVRHFLEQLEQDRTCSWQAGPGLGGFYDAEVNLPTSASREVLDALNAAFQQMPSAKVAEVSPSPVEKGRRALRADGSQGAVATDGPARAAVG
jgi:DNA (cytosine-5)-methyltransferase 1